MNLNPEISVRFQLDEQGNPMVINKNGINHYKIEISAQNIPDDVYAANYQLDDSYISPFREEHDKENSFKFKTTTYGDYSIAASLLGKQKNYITSTPISKALMKSHENDLTNFKIQEALESIKTK